MSALISLAAGLATTAVSLVVVMLFVAGWCRHADVRAASSI